MNQFSAFRQNPWTVSGFATLLLCASFSAPAHAADTIVRVTKTIVLTERGKTYDFSGKLHVWKGRNWKCTAEQENGPQILRIEADNVTVKNFKFIGDGRTSDSNGLGDPIHIASCGEGQGNLCPRRGPRNVVLDGIQGHACEDLITIGTPGSENITIRNSVLRATPSKANWDKTIQVNFGKNIKILNNRFEGGERCVRFKPNTSGEVRGNTFNGCVTAIQASSNDADIEPMRNGPTVLAVSGNKFNGVTNRVKTVGGQVTIKE